MPNKGPNFYKRILFLCVILRLMAGTKGVVDLNVDSMALTHRDNKASIPSLRFRRRILSKENKELESRERGTSEEKINFRLKNRDLKNRLKFQITPENYTASKLYILRGFPKNNSQENPFLNYRKHRRKLNKNRCSINLTLASEGSRGHHNVNNNPGGSENLWGGNVGEANEREKRFRRTISSNIWKKRIKKRRSNPENLFDSTLATNKNPGIATGTDSTGFALLVSTSGTASLVRRIPEPNLSGKDAFRNVKSVQPISFQSDEVIDDSKDDDVQESSYPLAFSDPNSFGKQEKHLRRSVQSSSSRSKGSPDGGELPVHKRTSVQYSSLVGPSFVNASANARTHALAGQTARLNCVIRNLHNFTVSWIRAGDINLLTSGKVTYSSDNRFVSVNPSNGERWVLNVHHVRLSDAGKYLCQISASPPINTPVTLIVTEAVAEVYPANEIFLKVGSPVRLICTIHGCPYPALPAWYRGRELQKELIVEESSLTFVPTRTTSDSPAAKHTTESVSTSPSSSREPVSINSTEKLSTSLATTISSMTSSSSSSISVTSSTIAPSSSSPVVKEILVARVIFERPKATLSLSGLYSCTNTCTQPINLTLHVLIGDEETAAMQHINKALSLNTRSSEATILLLVMYLYFLACT